MRPRAPGGFSLAEMVVALGLSFLTLAAAAGLLASTLRTQVAARASVASQLGVDAALGAVERELRQATLVGRPLVAGVPSSALEGCLNAAVAPGAPAPVPIDASASMSGFAVCAADRVLWLHQGPGCPLAYSCGEGSGVALAGVPGGAAEAEASFTRAVAGQAIAADLTVRCGAESARAFTTVALAQAAARPR
ncbi:MAG: hypothetical protein HY552_05680 [Elusimicrobia bacterium]|nr:hypothetical protein [Elusimicrobiota bacterium]